MNTIVIFACLVIGMAAGYFLCKWEHLKYPVIKWVEKEVPVETVKEVPVLQEKVSIITKEIPVIKETVKEVKVPEVVIKEVVKEVPVEKTLMVVLSQDDETKAPTAVVKEQSVKTVSKAKKTRK